MALENNGDDISESQTNNDSHLSLLASSPDPIPILLCDFQRQIPIKLPLRFQHSAWLITVYFAGYNAEIPDFLFHSEAISGSNDTK